MLSRSSAAVQQACKAVLLEIDQQLEVYEKDRKKVVDVQERALDKINAKLKATISQIESDAAPDQQVDDDLDVKQAAKVEEVTEVRETEKASEVTEVVEENK